MSRREMSGFSASSQRTVNNLGYMQRYKPFIGPSRVICEVEGRKVSSLGSRECGAGEEEEVVTHPSPAEESGPHWAGSEGPQSRIPYLCPLGRACWCPF